ncbi:hypothetical protein AB0L50_16070 [Streptomyces flaveolus]|uniref:hypothetical protein n=1 Tax=Streptomyces flaveolus TaxID=67297 RepID=UPI0034245DD0
MSVVEGQDHIPALTAGRSAAWELLLISRQEPHSSQCRPCSYRCSRVRSNISPPDYPARSRRLIECSILWGCLAVVCAVIAAVKGRALFG